MTMDSEPDPEVVEPPSNFLQNTELDKEFVTILNYLTGNEQISFKSQQKGEADLTQEEKTKIGVEIFAKNKLQFLLRFGQHLLSEHLGYFNKFTSGNNEDADDIRILLNGLSEKVMSNKKKCNVKNRRYEALKEMISDNKYFSEIEMMKRNPLLYDQLIGKYLTQEEIRDRDKYCTEDQSSFVKILMEGIERNDAEKERLNQEECEDNAMEESDSDSDEQMQDDDRSRSPQTSRSLWGEYQNEDKAPKAKQKNIFITAPEKKLLREEFITTMYQSFLDGADEDFDYETVDCNAKYDNMETMEHDEEDKYFDSEEPEIVPTEQLKDEESSDDELDIYMSALNDNPTVLKLSADLKNINTSN